MNLSLLQWVGVPLFVSNKSEGFTNCSVIRKKQV